jgi:hypothetical protein
MRVPGTVFAPSWVEHVWTGTQWTSTVGPGATQRWFTWGWPTSWHVFWYLLSTSPCSGAPQLDWEIVVEGADNSQCTYWITVRNLTSRAVTFEGRFAVLS